MEDISPIMLYRVALPLLRVQQERSRCSEGHVAALLTAPDFSKIYAAGNNGGTDRIYCLCKAGDKYKCVHAEINTLISKPVNLDLHKTPTVMLISKAPCVSCAAAMINAGVRGVYYIEDYKYTAGIELLQMHGIPVTKLQIGDEWGCQTMNE